MGLLDYLKYTQPSKDEAAAAEQIKAAKHLMTAIEGTPTPPPVPDPNPTPTPDPTTLVMGVAVSGLEFAETNLPGKAGTNYPVYPAATYTNAGSKFKAIRLPFVSDRLFEGSTTTFVAAYKKILDDAIAASPVPVWLDPHNYGRKQGKSQALGTSSYPVSLFIDRLKTLATAYKDNPKVECIELDNEPHDLSSRDLWYDACKQAVPIMQIVGWNKLIGVPVYHWSSMDDFFVHHLSNFIAPIKGDKIRWVFHNYFNKGNTGYDHPAEPNESAQVHVDRLNKVVDWAKAQGVTLAITEFGVPPKQSWVDNMKPFVAAMKSSKVISHAFYWATGDWYASDTVYKPIHDQAIL